MIIEDYVSFETAKLLKEKGFDVYARSYYEKDKYKTKEELCINVAHWNWNISSFRYSAPTIQMAMKWLREIHDITIGITFSYGLISYEIQKNGEFVTSISSSRTYEQMVEEAIQLCVKTLI